MALHNEPPWVPQFVTGSNPIVPNNMDRRGLGEARRQASMCVCVCVQE